MLFCEATVKCPQVGLEIGEPGRAWNGYNMIPVVQHPGQGNLRCHASLLGSNLLDHLHQFEVRLDVSRLKPRLHPGPEISLAGGPITG